MRRLIEANQMHARDWIDSYFMQFGKSRGPAVILVHEMGRLSERVCRFFEFSSKLALKRIPACIKRNEASVRSHAPDVDHATAGETHERRDCKKAMHTLPTVQN